MLSHRNKASSTSNLRTIRSRLNTLGEGHLSGTFSYTMDKITNLGVEVERLKSLNANLTQKIAGIMQQRENIVAKNFDLEIQIVETKNNTDKLLEERINKENELLNLKKELAVVCQNWDLRKKELELEIHNAKGKRIKVNEEKQREQMVLDHQKVRVAKYLQIKRTEINTQRPEIESQHSKINTLRNREINSKNSIALETERFRKFLDSLP